MPISAFVSLLLITFVTTTNYDKPQSDTLLLVEQSLVTESVYASHLELCLSPASPQAEFSLRDELNSAGYRMFSFDWAIQSFSSRKDRLLRSKLFSVSAVPLQLEFQASGNGDEVSCFLVAPRAKEWGAEDRVKISWLIAVFNIRGSQAHYQSDIQNVTLGRRDDRAGITVPMTVTELLDPGRGWLNESGSLHLYLYILEVLPDWSEYDGAERTNLKWLRGNARFVADLEALGAPDIQLTEDFDCAADSYYAANTDQGALSVLEDSASDGSRAVALCCSEDIVSNYGYWYDNRLFRTRKELLVALKSADVSTPVRRYLMAAAVDAACTADDFDFLSCAFGWLLTGALKSVTPGGANGGLNGALTWATQDRPARLLDTLLTLGHLLRHPIRSGLIWIVCGMVVLFFCLYRAYLRWYRPRSLKKTVQERNAAQTSTMVRLEEADREVKEAEKMVREARRETQRVQQQQAQQQRAQQQRAQHQRAQQQKAQTQQAQMQQAQKEQAQTQEAQKEQAQTQQAQKQEAQKQEAKVQQAQMQQAQKEQAQTQEAQKEQAQTQQAQKKQAQKKQAQKKQVQTQQAQKKQAQTQQVQAQEAQTQEAQKQEAQKQEAQKQEAKVQQAQMQQAKKERAQTQQAQKEHAQTQKAQTQRAQKEQVQTQQVQTQQVQTQQVQTQQVQTQQAQEQAQKLTGPSSIASVTDESALPSSDGSDGGDVAMAGNVQKAEGVSTMAVGGASGGNAPLSPGTTGMHAPPPEPWQVTTPAQVVPPSSQATTQPRGMAAAVSWSAAAACHVATSSSNAPEGLSPLNGNPQDGMMSTGAYFATSCNADLSRTRARLGVPPGFEAVSWGRTFAGGGSRWPSPPTGHPQCGVMRDGHPFGSTSHPSRSPVRRSLASRFDAAASPSSSDERYWEVPKSTAEFVLN